MRTSLQGIARKAKENKRHRFRDLYRLLNEEGLLESWRRLNKAAAAGADRVTAREYERELLSNIRELVKRLKEKRYKAKLVRRVYIPKGGGKLRPLGIPALEDRLVQGEAAQILNAIYEQDFLSNSFGYRPKRGALEAVQRLSGKLQFEAYSYVVEADIKGFFDHIDHQWLIRMLELRIDDGAFLGLIKKWLKAGILSPEGMVEHPEAGTPQGGLVSPILANVYLHYALDLWFERVVKQQCRRGAYLCRYADDFVAIFDCEEDAKWFHEQLASRLAKFHLEVAAEKTRVIRFSRDSGQAGSRFDFLGFEFRWGTDRSGKTRIRRRTSTNKLRKSLANFTTWCREHRNDRLRKIFWLLNLKLRGYYNYYGVIGNYRRLKQFFDACLRILYKWLNRRSQHRSFDWGEFRAVVARYDVLRPHITQTPSAPVPMLAFS